MKLAITMFAPVFAVALAVPPMAVPVAAQGGVETGPVQNGRGQGTPHPLQRLAAEQMLVLPVQYLTFADSLGWSRTAPSSRSYLNTVDQEIAFALKQRGLQGRWTLAPELVRSVERNKDYAPDPHALAADEVRSGEKGASEWQLREPLASQLRALVALSDARYIFFPVELKFTGSGGAGHATLHLVIVDARRSQVQWTGDLAGSQFASFSPAIAADLASRLGDLIAAPVN